MAARLASQNQTAPETSAGPPTRLDLTLIVELGILAAIVFGLFGEEIIGLFGG